MKKIKKSSGKLKFRKKKSNKLMHPVIFAGAFAILGSVLFATTYAAPNCYSWSNQESLQNIVDVYDCVNIVPGSYAVNTEVMIRNNRTVTINGNGAVFTAVRPPVEAGAVSDKWLEVPNMANRALFRAAANSRLIINNATLDGANIASYLVIALGADSKYSIDKMTLKNGACSAVGIFTSGITITNSYMVHNGFNCQPFSGLLEAAAIYGENQLSGYHFSPVISGNTITDSNGPALDINGVWGGTFSNNFVFGNTNWAAVSLYGASYWKITNNTVSHPATTSVQAHHPYCQPSKGPIGNRSAAIFLCQDLETVPHLTNFNLIEGNNASGGYGILLIGADEIKPWITPRINTIKNNNLIGSQWGCADDFKLKQWFNDVNTWTGNNCTGKPNTAPTRF